ncbi:MAG TPA: hypothetical protein VN695_05270 [Streptosporangiaceae bacterium]|nr:hypothetical protein [Streptosporangiaceae bacterium]
MNSDRQFYSLHSWLVPSAAVSAAVDALPVELKDHSSTSDLTDSNGHIDCCYFGELGWREVGCAHQHDGPFMITRSDGTTLTLTPTVESYTWEGVIWDCSIEESVHATLPSTFIQRSSNLRWRRDSATWSDGDQLVMCYRPTAAEYHGELFAVREDWLRGYLAEQGMALILAVRGQRDHQDSPREYSWTEFSLSSSYDAGTLLDGNAAIVSRNTAEVS